MKTPLDLAELRRWVGEEETVDDVVTEALAARFHATLSLDGRAPKFGEDVPRLIHFCLCQPLVPTEALGADGHPARGGFLPPVPLPRRMWAASTITFNGDLRVGDAVRRRSRVADVVSKAGRTGELCFVTVDHAITVGAELRVEESQTIVYRGPQVEAAASRAAPAPCGEMTLEVEPSSVLLFRYSALTFNGHRIHYDADYATNVENYPGLVVQGPLQATLLLHFAARQRGRQPDQFSFRGLEPLYGGETMFCHAAPFEGDALALWTARAGGPTAMQAQAGWLFLTTPRPSSSAQF